MAKTKSTKIYQLFHMAAVLDMSADMLGCRQCTTVLASPLEYQPEPSCHKGSELHGPAAGNIHHKGQHDTVDHSDADHSSDFDHTHLHTCTSSQMTPGFHTGLTVHSFHSSKSAHPST